MTQRDAKEPLLPVSQPDQSQEKASHRRIVRGLSGLPATPSAGAAETGSGSEECDGGTYSHLGDAVEPADNLAVSEGDEEDPLLADSDAASTLRGVTWQQAAAILLADMFGLGTLTLPADFARLGWLLAVVVVGACAVGMVFSGLLFTRLAVSVPRASTFADFGRAAYGRRGVWAVFAVVYSTILLEPVIFQLTTTESLLQMLQSTGTSRLTCGAVVAGIMLPLSQVQSIEEVSWSAILGTVGMLLTVAVALVKLYFLAPPHDRPVQHMQPIHTGNWAASMVAVMDVVFTYGGQVNWPRYISGLRRRQDFKYSVSVTALFMTLIYMAIGLYGYYKLGFDFDHSKPVSSILPYDAWTVVMNAGVLVHCIIAYQINLNVWTDVVLHLTTPSMVTDEARLTGKGRRVWATVSIAGILFSFVVAQTFPFFSTVVAVIAALGDCTAAYALPALFCLKLAKPHMQRWEVLVSYVVIPVSIALSGVGMFTSIKELIAQFIKH